MSIDYLPDDGETEVWDLSKVLPGEVINIPAPEGDEDIADGVLEVIPDRRPVLYDASSRAMVVAGKVGRGAAVVTKPLAIGGVWFGVGAKHTCILGWRYVRAYDHQAVVGGMQSDSDFRAVARTRRSRWTFMGWSALATAVTDTLGWWAITAWGGIPADTSWMILPGAEAAAAVAGVTAYGYYRVKTPGIPAGQILHDDDMPDAEEDDEPFPLAWCKDGHEVEDCVSRALFAEGIDTRTLTALGHRRWGWEVDLNLKGGSSAKLNAALDNLDVHFDLAKGGTLPETDAGQASHVTLRLVTDDPFADMPRPMVHAPNSLSVRDLVAYGQGMDGSPLEFRLQGMSMLLVGSSGAAKTKGALRSLLEAITACRDAIAVEMDPVKDGLSEFEGVMAAPPVRGGKACIAWLRHLSQIAKARNGVKSRLGMGDLWKPSREHPTIFTVVDEFIYLPPEAKELAIELLRLGRETGVHLIFAAQESTQDALGDAVASAVTYRIMLASRAEDIHLVFGKGASADGYRPDRLRPAVDEERVYDAGKFYIKGPGFLRPIQWRWHRLEREQIRQAVAERKAAGRPWFDHDSLAAADLLHVITRNGAVAESDLSVADRLDLLPDARAGQVAALLRMFEAKEASFLPTAVLVEEGELDDGEALHELLSGLVPGATRSRPRIDGKPTRGWDRGVIERAASALLA